MNLKSLSRWSLVALATSILLVPVSESLGAGIKIGKVEVVAFTDFYTLHAANNRPTGAIEKHVPPKGSVLWLVSYDATPEWDDATENISLEEKDFGLFDGAKRMQFRGQAYSHSAVDEYVSAPYFSRPDNWKTEPAEPRTFRYLVIVPEDKQELTLKVGAASAPVKLTAKAVPFDMNDYVEVRVRTVKLLDMIEEKQEGLGGVKQITNAGGSIMQLTLQITPKRANSISDKKPVFNWDLGWVALGFGKGGRATCMGTKQYEKLSPYGGGEINEADAGVWDSRTLALYFPVPSNIKTFEVQFLGHVVAKGAVE